MADFIAKRIIKARQIGLEEGQEKYIAYFIHTSIYSKYRVQVDTYLTESGYADCIVVE